LLISVAEELYARGDRIRVVVPGRAPVPEPTTARSRQPLGLDSTERARLPLPDGLAKALSGTGGDSASQELPSSAVSRGVRTAMGVANSTTDVSADAAIATARGSPLCPARASAMASAVRPVPARTTSGRPRSK
jgi:hypothetical protein